MTDGTNTLTRKNVADEIDIIDQSIADLNGSKRDTYAAYREQLEASGMAKENVKTELAALKAAIKRRRAVVADERAVEERDGMVDEVFNDIYSRAPRTSHERDAA